ncbi:MAG TPA: ElyC/SanA/YdcF family protein [Terriglobales bacterium]|nr:ElyC/SanA/YdcF family protein [Terriglobales bacterium]
MRRWRRRIILSVAGLLLLLIFFLGYAGRFLVVDQPQRSEAIVVLAGGRDDRYYKGLEMLGKGYANILFLDARTDVVVFGRTPASMGQAFIQTSAGALLGKTSMCPITGDSTYEEAAHVADCLRPTGARHVLLVTSDYHTRRAFQIVRARMPQYQWSVGAAHNSYDFGVNWWRHREWAKTTLLEWTKLLWWEAVDRWR